MGRSTNVPFSILISARLPLLTLRASATAFGLRTARLFPHLQNSTIMAPLRKVDTMYIQCRYGLQAFWTGDSLHLWLVRRLPNAEQCDFKHDRQRDRAEEILPAVFMLRSASQ